MKTWRERLEMKAEQFYTQRGFSGEMKPHQIGPDHATEFANAHLAGLAEVLEGVEAALTFYANAGQYEHDRLVEHAFRAREALAALRAWREGK